jgi:hypothetical protein
MKNLGSILRIINQIIYIRVGWNLTKLSKLKNI